MIYKSLKTRELVITALLRFVDTVDSISLAVEGSKGISLNSSLVDHLSFNHLKSLDGDVLLLEINFSDPAEIRTLEDYVAGGDNLPIIVTASAFDVPSMRALMKIGILDILPQPVTLPDLLRAVDNVSRKRRPVLVVDNVKKGVVVSFLKSCGGVGATSLVVQGACAIGRGRKPVKPVLLDLDIQFGMAAILMDAEQRSSIVDLIRDPKRLDGELLQRTMVRPHDRFDLLAAPAQILPVEKVDAAAIAVTIATARRTYDQVLIDLPMLWDDWVCAALESSDLIVLVLRLTIPSLRQARHQLDMLRSENLGNIPIFIVANAVESSLFGTIGVSLKDGEKALGQKIDFCIPKSTAMQVAAEMGQPLNEVGGGKSLEAKLASMMTEIFERIQTAPLTEATGT